MIRRELLGRLAAAAVLLAICAGPSRAEDAAAAAIPDDSIALHYHRADGNYANWGVHFWESFEGVKDGKVVSGKDKSDMPVVGITWGAPMQPTGTDGFGPYWVVKANEFRNGKINYIIHRGDSKDCARDSQWFLTQGRQVFINAGDCTAYFSAAEAAAARK